MLNESDLGLQWDYRGSIQHGRWEERSLNTLWLSYDRNSVSRLQYSKPNVFELYESRRPINTKSQLFLNKQPLKQLEIIKLFFQISLSESCENESILQCQSQNGGQGQTFAIHYLDLSKVNRHLTTQFRFTVGFCHINLNSPFLGSESLY